MRDQLIAEARKSAEAEKAILLAQSSQEIAKLHERGRSGDRAGPSSGGTGDHRSRERTLRGHRAAAAWTAPVEDCPVRIPRWTLSGAARTVIRGKSELTSATAADHAIEVVTAAPLSKEESDHVRDALKAAFGSEPGLCVSR